ncbi:hypothetical protein N9A72_00460 [bacterium]|nr:hypothetical protein [bacterium]
MTKKLIILVIILLFSCGYAASKTINVDGNLTGSNEWVVVSSTETSPNSAIIKNGEWIWTDMENDERKIAVSTDNASCDITEFRVTADDSKIYFLIKFRELEKSATTQLTYPFIQIAMDYDDNGASIFPDDTVAPADQPTVDSDALWEYMIWIVQSSPTVSAAKLGVIEADEQVNMYGDYNHKISSGFIEASAPLTRIGRSGNYLNKTVRFTVAEFVNYMAILSTAAYGSVTRLESGKCNIIDCLSITDDPDVDDDYEGTAGTWEEVEDNIVNSYFDITFESDGDVKSNAAPETPAVDSLKVNDKKKNPDVTIGDTLPLLSWSFSDSDSGNEQIAFQILISTSSDFSSFAWNPSPILSENEYVSYGGATLIANTTYYWKVRLMDNHGTYSSWSSTQTFNTIRTATDISKTANDMVIEWNNPFNPSSADAGKKYTIIKYHIGGTIDQQVYVRIYNINGELVKSLIEGEVKTCDTTGTERWYGDNDNRKTVASGVYLVNIKIGDSYTKTERVVILK